MSKSDASATNGSVMLSVMLSCKRRLAEMKVPKRIKTLIVDCPNEDCVYWRNRDCKYSAYLMVAQCGEYKPIKKEEAR